MGNRTRLSMVAAVFVAVSAAALCQMALPAPDRLGLQTGTAAPGAPESTIPGAAAAVPVAAPPAILPSVQALLAFRDSDVKFSVAKMMEILRDKRHEGWVLAAYPDPKTSRPLIGAGFSLDLPARVHPQLDAQNPNPFFEPSSAELWQAAGLDPAALSKILDQFHDQMSTWTVRQFRLNIRNLPPQITDDDADKLLRVAIIQSIVNARAYCRNFDELTASQQMAMSQLVYQMGVNLEEFTQFRALINHDAVPNVGEADQKEGAIPSATGDGAAYWKAVQLSLVQSQWARTYRTRAVAVVAMFDPSYASNPTMAERRVSAVLHPVGRRRKGSAIASTTLVASHSKHSRGTHGKSARASGKKKV